MTSIYEIHKANRIGRANDFWTALVAQKWKASEEEFKEYTGLVPYTFIANGQPLIDWYIKGNMQQTGTPTPENPIMPQGCGDLETVGAKAGQYKIPILSNSTTTPVYLGEVQTTRRIKKLVLTGEERDWVNATAITATNAYQNATATTGYKRETFYCSHMVVTTDGVSTKTHGYIGQRLTLCMDKTLGLDTVGKFKSYLAAQYAAGTPVTVWYVLATEETGIVNEPLMKIGEYVDSISDVVSIPTVRGENVFDVDTEVKPSEAYIKYKSR